MRPMTRLRVALVVSAPLCLWIFACDLSHENSDGTSDARHERVPPFSGILITLDTTRVDSLSAYGGPPDATPNIARLARQGLRYDAARSVAPITMPSHASMLTGLFPPRHTVRNNNIEPLPRSAHTLAELARENGLETAAFVSSVALDAALGFDQGFDHYESPPRGVSHDDSRERRASETVDLALEWLQRREPGDTAKSAESAKSGQRAERFFLWLHLFDPHDPYAAPPEFARRFPRDPYLAEVAYLDSELGRLLDFLATEGYLDNTLVMLAGDHGEALGQHGETFHGIYLYDSTIRVPLIVRDPGGWRAGESTREIVSVADVFPTLAEAMGLPAQDGIDGVSLFRRSAPKGRGVYFETYQAWVLHGYAPAAGWADAAGKYLHSAQPEFYEIDSDPAEERNLATQRADAMPRYRDAIAAVIAAPSLTRSHEGADHSMLAELQALGYAAASTGDRSFPHPLDIAGRPNSAAWVTENAALLEAKRLAREGRFEDAIAIHDSTLLGNPHNWIVIHEYGFTLMRAGRHEDALEQIQRYQTGGPPLAASFMNAGICLLRLDREDEAVLQFEHAVNLKPHFEPALRQLARLHREAGRLAESERWQKQLRALQSAH